MDKSNVLKGYMFDENGQRINIDNVDIFVSEMEDRLLVNTYRNTIYQHTLILEMESLVEKGYAKTNSDESYDGELTINSLNSMAQEIEMRFGEEYHQEVIDSVDLSFLDNKPENL
jgi:hypothetical protein